MAGRRTNLALLWTSVLALLTGVTSFTVGTTPGAWIIVLHGITALVIVVLVPWKSSIVGRGLKHRRRGRLLSLGLTLAVVMTLITGGVLVTGLVPALGPFTTMQLHVTAGLLMISLLLIHTLQRPVPHRATDFSRRNALRAGGILAAAGGLWLLVEGGFDLAGTRSGRRRFTGSHELSDPAAIPYTQWTNDSIQHLDASTHKVDIAGVSYSPDDIALGGDSVTATLDCTGGWYTTQLWTGTRLDRLIGEASGESVVVRSITGYWRRFPLAHADRLFLATHIAGEALADGNGGPVRLVALDRRGFWWVKWVTAVEVDDVPPFWQPPLPTA